MLGVFASSRKIAREHYFDYFSLYILWACVSYQHCAWVNVHALCLRFILSSTSLLCVPIIDKVLTVFGYQTDAPPTESSAQRHSKMYIFLEFRQLHVQSSAVAKSFEPRCEKTGFGVYD